MSKYKLIIIFICFICEVHSQVGELFVDSDRNIQNFVIKISRSLENYDRDLIDLIKVNMKYASKALFKATDNLDKFKSGIKFGKIYISIPNEWKTEHGGFIKDMETESHFKIIPEKPKKTLSKPFTKQVKKCGSQGKYSVFSDKFLKSNSTDQINLIKNGKRIMREFVKFRYGVFSEKPYKNILFIHDGKKFVNGICNQNIEWKVNNNPEKCSDKNSKCRYTIKKYQNHTYSVMFDIDTPSSEYFCNDKDRPHNSLAYNLHNIICEGKSVTSVILNHTDFKNAPREEREYVDPTFEIISKRGRQFVFVLDTSGSMNDVAIKMKALVKEFTKNVENSAEIGIVAFRNKASVISQLMKINETGQQILFNKIRNISCYGFSSIANGLKLGMEVLLGNSVKKSDETKAIILITDEDSFGDKNKSYLKKTLLALSKTEIVLHVFSFAKETDSIFKKLAKKTEGSYQKFGSNVAYEKLFKDLIEKYRTKDKEIELYSNNSKYNFKYSLQHFNNYTIFNVKIKKNLKKYIVTLNYSDVIINPLSVNYTKSSTDLVFRTLTKAKPGKYLLIFKKIPKSSKKKHHKQSEKEETLQMIQFSLYGKPNNLSERNINPVGEISKSFIDVLNEFSSVTVTVDVSNCGIIKDEIVRIKLEIQPESKNNYFKQMKDDGFGDDSIAGDKLFTTNLYSKDLLEKGYYTFYGHVEIKNIKTEETIKRNVMFENLFVKDVSESASYDKISPAQLMQPTIIIVNHNTIELKTIATGDDSMDGKINKYQIFIRSDTETIVNVTKSAEPYDEIKFRLELENKIKDTVLEISIRGVDKNDNVGEWSVAAPVSFRKSE